MTAAPSPPSLGFLLAGFALLVIGLAWLSRTRPADLTLRSVSGTRRALGYAVIYALTAACFSRLINPALTEGYHSPWLLALGDVISITLGLFAWLLVLVEDLPAADLGLRWAGGRRGAIAWILCIAMGIIASLPHYVALLRGTRPFSMDAMVFGGLFAACAVTLPQEIIFRGYFQGSLESRMAVAPRVLLQAGLYVVLHLGRAVPGVDISWTVFLAETFGLLLPAGIFWGAMRELAGGSILPVIVSHFLLRFGEVWHTATPAVGDIISLP